MTGFNSDAFHFLLRLRRISELSKQDKVIVLVIRRRRGLSIDGTAHVTTHLTRNVLVGFWSSHPDHDMPLKSHISSDLFLYIPPNSDRFQSGLTQKPPCIIFFITGNPGLVGYYHTFLSMLADLEEGKRCVIFGASLGGFEVEASTGGILGNADADVVGLLFPGATEWRQDRKIWKLREQVELCIARVDELVRRVQEEIAVDEGMVDRRRPVKLILMGHSVGAWIALEMIRCMQLEKQQLERAKPNISRNRGRSESVKSNLGKGKEHWSNSECDVEAAMLLTPTIMDLPLSTSGRIAGPLLGNIHYLPELARLGSTGMKWLVGEQWLRWLVSSVTGMQEDEGSGLDTTVNFLLSDRGVQQSLSLARDELRIIGDDAWGEEVWATPDEEGREHGKTDNVGLADGPRVKRPRLYFLFAEKDHWVADETRKKILEKRRMGHRYVVDEEGLQHAWCLRQNKEVADRVKEWWREITGHQT